MYCVTKLYFTIEILTSGIIKGHGFVEECKISTDNTANLVSISTRFLISQLGDISQLMV